MNALAEVTSVSPAIWSREHCGAALSLLLAATLRHETWITARDTQIEAIRQQHEKAITCAAEEVRSLEMRLDEYWTSHREELCVKGKAELQFSAGTIGARVATNPALIPVNEKWPWEKIARAVKRRWGLRYFHKPDPPGLDKVKLKSSLDEEQLAKCGLKLDDTEKFYVKLSRLAEAA